MNGSDSEFYDKNFDFSGESYPQFFAFILRHLRVIPEVIHIIPKVYITALPQIRKISRQKYVLLKTHKSYFRTENFIKMLDKKIVRKFGFYVDRI